MPDEKLASRWLVSTDWLSQHLIDPDVIVLDGSYYLANAKRDAEAEFLAGHIPGAQRFDIDAVSDKSNPLPHMLPSPEQFATRVKKLEAQMYKHAQNLEFEDAARVRDEIHRIREMGLLSG